MQIVALQNLLLNEIPLAASMGVRILALDDMTLDLALPLLPNRNHKNTLFGGSLYSASALACYGLFLNGLEDQGFRTKNIVIGDGDIKYFAPVTGDAVVRAEWPSAEEKSAFFDQLKHKGKARVRMKAGIEENGRPACEFTGRFVAFFP
jgi:thioesterase domain-containing protein